MQRKPIAKLVAVHKQIGKEIKRRRAELQPGVYDFDGQTTRFTLNGTVKVGENYDQQIVGKAKPWNIVAVLMAELNALRVSTGFIVVDLATIAVIAEEVAPELWEKAQADADTAIAAIKAPTQTPCFGKTTFKGKVV